MDAVVWIVGFVAALISVLWVRARVKGGKPKGKHQHVVAAPLEFDDSTEVVIVGSGILGSAMGATLARDGRRVTVIERDLSEPDRIVGELLQPGGYRALKELGLQDAVENIDAHVVHGYCVHDNDSGSSVCLSYPEDDNHKVITGRSFHHGRFVMGLRKEAKNAGVMLIEGTVSTLLEDENGHIVGVAYKDRQTATTKTMRADLTIVADGCFSKFRKGLVAAPVSVSSHFTGLIMHDCPQFKTGFAEIVLAPTGPILVYQISSKSTRILVDIQGKMPSNIKEYMKNTIGPHLPDHMTKAFNEALDNERLRTMPNSFLPPVANPIPGVLLLGDAFNMRHPLTGAGMSVALNDTTIWRKYLASIPDLKDHAKILQCLKSFQWQRKSSHSFVINVLAQALYALFSASDVCLHDLRKACFAYFQLGGMAVTGPVGLLSVLRPKPMILIGHFFAVAIYAIYLTAQTYSVFAVHRAIYRCFMIFTKACKIIFPLVGSELTSVLR